MFSSCDEEGMFLLQSLQCSQDTFECLHHTLRQQLLAQLIDDVVTALRIVECRDVTHEHFALFEDRPQYVEVVLIYGFATAHFLLEGVAVSSDDVEPLADAAEIFVQRERMHLDKCCLLSFRYWLRYEDGEGEEREDTFDASEDF